jgi:hypothetical protein
MDDDDVEVPQNSTRDIAVKALTHILLHERLCAKRWGLILKISIGTLGLLGMQVVLKLFEFVHLGPPT